MLFILFFSSHGRFTILNKQSDFWYANKTLREFAGECCCKRLEKRDLSWKVYLIDRQKRGGKRLQDKPWNTTALKLKRALPEFLVLLQEIECVNQLQFLANMMNSERVVIRSKDCSRKEASSKSPPKGRAVAKKESKREVFDWNGQQANIQRLPLTICRINTPTREGLQLEIGSRILNSE